MKERIRVIIMLLIIIEFIVTTPFLAVSESMTIKPNSNEMNESEKVDYTSKITPTLQDVIQEKPDKMIPVLIWMKDVDLSGVMSEALLSLNKDIDSLEELTSRKDISLDDFQKYIQTKRNLSSALYEEHNNRIVHDCFDGKDIIYISRYSPVVLLYLDVEEIVKVSQREEVMLIDYYFSEENENEISIANSVTRASLVYPSYGYGGYGIKIGVLEESITNAYFPGVNVVSQNGTVSAYQEPLNHVNSVVSIISSIAPDAQYYIADNSVMSNFQAIEWLLSQGVNIINASKKIDNDGCNTYGSVSKWLDHIAYNHDVHFVKSSGNEGETGVTSGGMAYNIVTVGNINDNRTLSYTDDDIATDSSFYYDYDNSHLTSKPDICAPGVGISTEFGTGSGTSCSAPQVAGAIALLCQGNPTLTIRQDAVKAILTCSVNYSSPLTYVPSDSFYKYFGAGLLDTCGAVWVAENTRYVASSISTNTSSKTYSFYVSSSDDRVRVSLAFLRNSSIGSSNHVGTSPNVVNLSDLDLRVYPPNSSTPIASSTKLYNNVEIVDFEPTVSGTYTIVITNYSSSATTYFGLAWK